MNHSAYDYQLGTINGIGQTVAAAARSIGPALGGLLWSLSVKIHFLYINFVVTVFIFLIMHAIGYRLPPSIDYAKINQKKNNSQQMKADENGVEMMNH